MSHEHHHHNHDHHHGHHHGSDQIGRAFFLNFCFLIVEIIGAFLTGSVMIFANAIHDLGDSLTLGMSFFLQKISKRNPDNRYTYGYARYSLFGSIVAGIVICASAIVIIIEAVPRLWQSYEPQSGGMIVIAVAGVIINGIAFVQLKFGKSQHEKILKWHFVEDVAGWVIVLIGSACISLFKWYWLDPVLAIILAIFVSYNVLRHMKDSVAIFFQQTPKQFETEKFLNQLRELKGVRDMHDLHVWTLDGSKHVLSMHIVVDDMSYAQEIKKTARHLASHMQVDHATIEIDLAGENCSITGKSSQ